MKSLMRLDPFRLMRRWDPIDDLRSMQREMDRLFDRFLGGETFGTDKSSRWMPSVESYEKDGKLVFKAELPGVDSKDLDVSVTGRELIIKGERKAEKGAKEENYVYQEITYGSFERHFLLPEGVKTEDVKAKFTNGILEITLPAPAISAAKKIEIETPKQIESATTVKKAA